MPNMSLKKNEMPVQDPNVRNKNFKEVALGYTEDQAVDEGFAGTQQGLGTARAFSAMQIDHGGAAIGQRRGHFRGHAGSKAHGHGHGRTEFQKVATADALLRQTFLPAFFAQTNGNTHTCLLSAG